MVQIKELDGNALYPTVAWAQRKETISLKVSVSDAKPPSIDLTDSSITFQVEGTGAKGYNIYQFSFDFYQHIDPEGCVFKVTSSHVDVQLTKQGPGEWWPRLLPDHIKKPHYLKLDFDRWRSESDDEEEVDEEKEAYMRKMKEALDVDENTKAAQVMQNFYLVFYNCVMFLLYSAIMAGCLIGYILHGEAFRVGVYESLGGLVAFTVALCYLEVLHPLMGMVKAPWLTSFIQVSGRCFALYCLWLGGEDVQKIWSVWYLYVVWSVADVIRYPVYVLQIVDMESKLLTWLRYHAWIVLYPFGGYCEYSIVKAAAVLFDEFDRYTYPLPGPLPLTLRFSTFMQVYCLVLVIGVCGLMRHMWKMRSKKFGGRRKFKAA